jgi:hypothetical protein
MKFYKDEVLPENVRAALDEYNALIRYSKPFAEEYKHLVMIQQVRDTFKSDRLKSNVIFEFNGKTTTADKVGMGHKNQQEEEELQKKIMELQSELVVHGVKSEMLLKVLRHYCKTRPKATIRPEDLEGIRAILEADYAKEKPTINLKATKAAVIRDCNKANTDTAFVSDLFAKYEALEAK